MSNQLPCALALCASLGAVIAAPAGAQMASPFAPSQAAGVMPTVSMPRPPSPFDGMPGYGGIPPIGMRQPNAPHELPRYLVKTVTTTPEVEKLLAQPEDEIDFGDAVLTLTKAIMPSLDAEHYSREISRLADGAKLIAGETNDSNVLLKAVHKVIYSDERYHYDFAENARQNDDNFLLPRVIDRKTGQCYGLTALFLAVAQRAGLRVYSVSAPQHIFVRVMGSGLTVRDFDPSSGSLTTDDYYVQHYKIAEKGTKSGAYLRTESRREFLAHVMHQNAMLLRRYAEPVEKGRQASVTWFEKAASVNPYAVETIETLRWAYEFERMEASRLRNMTLAAAFNDKATQAFKTTEELGLQGEPKE